MQSTVEDVAERLQIPELDVTYNIVYLSAAGIPYDDTEETGESGMDVSFLQLAGIMVGGLVLLASGLVIYNVLKISVSKRMKEYGVLRAIGGEKGQLYGIVSLQILFLCLIGIPIGMLIGFLSAKTIFSMATGFVSPEMFMVQDAAGLQELIQENSSGKPLLLAVGRFLPCSLHLPRLFRLSGMPEKWRRLWPCPEGTQKSGAETAEQKRFETLRHIMPG